MASLDMQALQPHQVRVLEERAELEERVSKLSTFLARQGSPSAPKVDNTELALLWRQLQAMRNLLGILDLRIKGFQ